MSDAGLLSILAWAGILGVIAMVGLWQARRDARRQGLVIVVAGERFVVRTRADRARVVDAIFWAVERRYQ